MEALIALVGGIAAAGIIAGFKKIGATLFISKYGTIIGKVFEVVDPIAGQLIGTYSGSEVQNAIKLAVARVADNTLDDEDIVVISNYILAKFDPTIAAVKTFNANSEEGKAAVQLLDSVKSLRDGVTFEEVLAVAKNAKALI